MTLIRKNPLSGPNHQFYLEPARPDSVFFRKPLSSDINMRVLGKDEFQGIVEKYIDDTASVLSRLEKPKDSLRNITSTKEMKTWGTDVALTMMRTYFGELRAHPEVDLSSFFKTIHERMDNFFLDTMDERLLAKGNDDILEHFKSKNPTALHLASICNAAAVLGAFAKNPGLIKRFEKREVDKKPTAPSLFHQFFFYFQEGPMEKVSLKSFFAPMLKKHESLIKKLQPSLRHFVKKDDGIWVRGETSPALYRVFEKKYEEGTSKLADNRKNPETIQLMKEIAGLEAKIYALGVDIEKEIHKYQEEYGRDDIAKFKGDIVWARLRDTVLPRMKSEMILRGVIRKYEKTKKFDLSGEAREYIFSIKKQNGMYEIEYDAHDKQGRSKRIVTPEGVESNLRGHAKEVLKYVYVFLRKLEGKKPGVDSE